METNIINDNSIEKKVKNKKGDIIFVIVLCAILFLMTALIIVNKFVFLNIYVEGQSMAPTLSSGDVLFAVRGNEFEEGDIIVIDRVKKNGDTYDLIIKRAIAIGQKDKTIIVEIKNGKVYVGDSDANLREINESYLSAGTNTYSDRIPARWVLEEGQIFYLGDNRANSSDSRYYGVCSVDKVVGVVPEWALSIRWLSGFMYNTGQFFSELFRGKQ